MKLLRLLTLSLSMVLGFACSDTDLEGVDPATAPGEQSSSGNRVIEITAGSIESKMIVDDSGEGTPISITWNTSDIVGMWTYSSTDYSTYEGNTDILKGTITALTNSGKTATFSSDEASADDPADKARLIFPYDAGSIALSDGGTAGAKSLFNINLSRQNASIAPYSSGLAYEYTHENMYMISDAVTIGDATIIRPITSLLRFYITTYDSNNTSGSINIYKVVCRKTQESDTENGSYIPVKVAVDLLGDIDANNANDLLSESTDGSIEVLATNPEYNTQMNSQICFTIPTLPITINPNDKIYLDVYYKDSEDNKYTITCEYSPKSINGSTTMTAGVAYDISVEMDVNDATKDESQLFSGGLGTEADPYIIKTSYSSPGGSPVYGDLDNLQTYVADGEDYEGVYFRLDDNIKYAKSGLIGTATAAFKGNIDGGGYTVTIDNEGVGLFGYVAGGTIKNLNVTTESSIGKSVEGYYGGIVAYLAKNSTLIDCSFVTTMNSVVFNNGNSGGLVGYNAGSIIGCYASTTLAPGTDNTNAGLVSVNEGLLVGGFFVNPNTTQGNAFADQICYSSTGTCEAMFFNSNSATGKESAYGTETEYEVNSEDFVDEINAEIFTYNMTATTRVCAWAINDTAGSLYPQRTETYPTGTLSSSTSEATWNDLITVDVDLEVLSNELSGSGTSDDPFLIQSELDFAMLSKYYNTNKVNDVDYGKHYLLTRDLDLSGRHWVSVGVTNSVQWDGTFDGGGHTIYGLYIANQGQRSGLFKFCAGHADAPAVVMNLNIDNGTISSSSNQSAGFCASLGSYSYACNLSFSGIVTGTNTCGGIAGQAYGGIFINCYAQVTLTTTQDAPSRNGGITGLISSASSIIGCYSDYTLGTAAVTDYSYGALTGANQGGLVQYCYWRYTTSTSNTPRVYSNEVSLTYNNTYVVDDLEGYHVRVDSYTNEQIVEALNNNLAEYQNNYTAYGLKPCKWKLDDNGEVALDFGNYLEGSDVGTDIPGSGLNPDGI